jgi:hypothetical protein
VTTEGLKVKLHDKVKLIATSEKPELVNEVFEITEFWQNGFVGVCGKDLTRYYISPLNIKEILSNKEQVLFT